MQDLKQIRAPGLDEFMRRHLGRRNIASVTEIQRKALIAGVADGKSLVVCAPTSSGKTLVGEIAVVQGIRNRNRCLYLVSHKALAEQKYEDLRHSINLEDAGHHVSVSLSTGDREEGSSQCDLMIATYERALSLVLNGRISTGSTVVVADELQILGDRTRGPSIEILCTLLKDFELEQFIALTATVENAGEIARWLKAELCLSAERDVDLFQEVRFGTRRTVIKFGDDKPLMNSRVRDISNPILVVESLLDQGRGPILVFAETRKEVRGLARRFARARPASDADLQRDSMQLALFAEPTDLSDDLLFAMRRKVAIHTADLSLDERSFIEAGISEGRFDVCFATSTLAAGVNFPFRTVVFPNLTYRYGDRKGTQILRSDYRNMSGRAGRLGIHDKGYAVLLAKNVLEAKHANRIIRPQNDRVRSQLAKMAPRRSVLALTASRQAISKRELLQFLESTFYASRLGSHNRRKLQAVLHDAAAALDWLVREQLASERRGKYQATPLGSAIARTGLLPETALEFAHCLRQRPERLGSSLERHPAGLIHWACCSPEFAGPDATRFLAWVNPRDAASSAGFLADLQKSNVLLRVLDPQDATVCGNVHALVQYAEGIAEREITRSTKISSGYVHGAAKEVSWVLHGFQAICSVPSLECPQRISNQIASLAAQVRWGVPLAALDLLQGARRAKVLGFGRQSAMALVRHGATGRDAIRAAAPGRLAKWIGSTRAEALLAALSQIFRAPSHPLEPTHRKLGRKLGIEDLLARLAKASSDDYPIVLALLLEKEHEWVVTATGAPWILLRRGDRCARVWAVASPEGDAIGKEQLQAILAQNHEAADESALVVVARAGFDRAAKAVGRSQPDVALMEHVALVEAMLRRLAGAASCDEVFDWLAEPGDSELERIPGEWSYALARTLEPA